MLANTVINNIQYHDQKYADNFGIVEVFIACFPSWLQCPYIIYHVYFIIHNFMIKENVMTMLELSNFIYQCPYIINHVHFLTQ